MRCSKRADRIVLETAAAEETRALGRALGHLLRGGDVLLLEGDLGAGKTTLVQGIAEGLGVSEPVTSPTFTLIHEYRTGRLTLYHLDPFRLAEPSDVTELGFDEYLEAGGVVAVEWAERLGTFAPNDHLLIRIGIPVDARSDRRSVELIGSGFRGLELVRLMGRMPC